MKRFFSTLAVLVALPALQIEAREHPLEPPDLDRYVRWGPVRVRPGFGITNLGYDDNVFFASGNQPRQGDYRVTVSPSLDGLVLFGDRAFLTFQEKLAYTFYRKFNEQNFQDQSFTTRTTFPLGRMGFFAELDLARGKYRPSSELDTRLDRRENRVGLGIILELGWRTFAEIERTRTDLEHSDPDIASVDNLLDRVEHGNELRLEYRLAGRTRLTLEAAINKITFDDPTAGRDSREKSLLPGVRFGEGGRLSGSMALGVTRIDLRDPQERDFSGLVGEAQLAYRLGRGTTLQLGGKREVDFAVFQQNNFFLDRSASTRVIHFFGRVLGFEVGGRRGKLTFPESGAVVERVDLITEYDLGIRVRLLENALGKRVEYTLKWQHYRRDSNPPFDNLDQSRSTIGLGVVVGF